MTVNSVCCIASSQTQVLQYSAPSAWFVKVCFSQTKVFDAVVQFLSLGAGEAAVKPSVSGLYLKELGGFWD